MNTNASTATTTTTTIAMMIHTVVLIRVPFCLADSGARSRCTLLLRNCPLGRGTRRGFIRNWRRAGHVSVGFTGARCGTSPNGRYAAWGRRLPVDELVTVAAAASTSATVGLGLVVWAVGSRRSRRR